VAYIVSARNVTPEPGPGLQPYLPGGAAAIARTRFSTQSQSLIPGAGIP
jgi:hypothetical protein